MRIVSLTPAATEIAFALGLGPSVVGVSHDSDWPPEAAARPVVTQAHEAAIADERAASGDERRTTGDSPAPAGVPAGGQVPPPAGEGQGGPRTGRAQALPRMQLLEPTMAELRPDLVLAPPAEDVVTSSRRKLREAVAGVGDEVELLTLDPSSLEGILHSISTVGAMTGAESAALRLVERLRARLGRLERRVQRRREQGRRPTRVVALEGVDPPIAAGRWIPEQVRRAGGWELLGHEGEPPLGTTWQAVRDVDPETVVLMPRGRHLDAAVEAWTAAPRPDGWDDLEAVHRGQVFAVDAESYFTRPGPRFVEGIALLAEVLDPDGFVETSPLASWTPVD